MNPQEGGSAAHVPYRNSKLTLLLSDALGAKGASTLWRTAEAGTAWWTWPFWCGMCAKSVDCAPDDDDAPLLGSGAL